MNIEKYVVDLHDSILTTMKTIQENANGIVFVCQGGTLFGSVTDGDIRRYILANGDITSDVENIANTNLYYLLTTDDVDYASYMSERKIKAIPIVDHLKRIVDIKFLFHDDEEKKIQIDVPVIIMAGGKGTRLKPITNILPKPLIPIGNKTITEHIMENFEKYGCSRFHMIVNYKKNLITSYFNEDENKRDIQFVEEKDFLGTAGGLSLLNLGSPTYFLTNCDILLNADYEEIYNYHMKHENVITMVCAKKKLQIPYGTVHISEDNQVQELVEKPKMEFLANTGFYIMQREFIEKIKKGTHVDITDIIQKCMDEKEKVGVYCVEEECWLDMGQFNELEQMRKQIG